jgi:hypothetical protein
MRSPRNTIERANDDGRSHHVTSEVAEFLLPADVTDEERAQLRQGLGSHAKVLAEDARVFRFAGAQLGQTGPVHHYQYLRLYRVQDGYVAIGHDLREGMKVVFADRPEELPARFDEETVREFVEDELRYRGVLGPEAPSQESRA